MHFSIIGSGNMAWFLARKLSAAGHHLDGIWSRNLTEAHHLAAQYNAAIYPSPDELPDQEEHCCFLAVSDHALAELAGAIRLSDTVLLHTAGGLSIHILQEAAVHYGVFWPVYSLVKNNITEYNDIPLAIEGNDEHAEKTADTLAQSISSASFKASEAQRNLLHLAAVFANNFTNHLLAQAEDICRQAQLSFDYLKPIIAQTFERVSHHSPATLQTGPAIRKDEQTMSKHLELLQGDAMKTALYRTLSGSIRKMYDDSAQ